MTTPKAQTSSPDGVIYNQIKKKEDLEFGGPIGVSALMIWSHLNLIYFW